MGLLLFLILINDCGYQNQEISIGELITNKKKKFQPATLHRKYVDDMSIIESFNLQETLLPNPDRPFPDSFHARLGLKLPSDKSLVYKQISEVQDYASENEMKLNFSKTKFMVFNPTLNHDFVRELTSGENEVETLEQMKLLGLTVTNDLKWKTNTENITKKGYARLWILRRLKKHGANWHDLKDVYIKQVRSVLEFGVPVWNCGLTKEDISDIERVQRSFLYIVFENMYTDYDSAMDKLELETLESRRLQICKKFAIKASVHPNHKSCFKVNDPVGTRSEKPNFKEPLARLQRYKNSPIPYLTRLLNKQ